MKRKIVGLMLLLAVIAAGCSAKASDDFARCLSEKGAVMYGTEWCSHCQEQKARFGKSFSFVEYVDCDKNREECLEKGIRGYPTWIINGERYSGVQSLKKLSELTSCPR